MNINSNNYIHINNDSINSFHYFDNFVKEDTWDVELDKVNSSSTFPIQFNKIFDDNITKKNSMDFLEIEDQNGIDKLNISEIKPDRKINTTYYYNIF